MAAQNAKKTVKKSGRTLLVTVAESSLPLEHTNNLTGLVNKVVTKTGKSMFLMFDTIENAVSGFRKLRSLGTDYRVKFSYYRVFFKLSGLTDTTDYNTIKSQLTDAVEAESNSSVLYCKFYKKDNKYMGCGDLTLDSMEGMNKLVALKEGLTVDSHVGNFYRFNNTKSTHEQDAE
jgi:hypothetical protein